MAKSNNTKTPRSKDLGSAQELKNGKKVLDIMNVGIVGHIDHGKTTLLKQLSGKWTDTHSEELKRGITIKLGYADVLISKDAKAGLNINAKGKAVRRVSFVDAPGHEMLMATMLSGAAMMDAAILVVAANEGVKPQTLEHLSALQARGVKNLIVVQNKIDLVSKEEAKKNHEKIKGILKGKFDNSQVIPISAQQGVNLDKIYEALISVELPDRDLKSECVFVVARSFDINKPGSLPKDLKGAVLGGALKRGKLKIGDEIELKPGRMVKDEIGARFESVKTKVRNLFIGSERVDEITPGGSMSIETELDMVLAKSDALAGRVVGLVGKLPEESKQLTLKFNLFKEVYAASGNQKVEEIKKGDVLMLSVNTSTSGGNVLEVRGNELKINLKVPVVPFKGESVGIGRNVGGHWRLIGYGTIVD